MRSDTRLVRFYEIFQVSNGRLSGFGRGGKKVFKEIAKTLRSFHLASSYCGSIGMHFRITLPSLNVLCPFTPVYTTDPNYLVPGISYDLLCFRSLLYNIINGNFDDMSILPIEFNLFFSRMFFAPALNIRESSFFLLCHPLFFDANERRRFIDAIFEFRKINPNGFDSRIDLQANSAVYGLDHWDQALSKGSAFYKILHYEDKHCIRKRPSVNYNSIPQFLRNVHHHYNDHDKVILSLCFSLL
jgi:hypothetical protein